MAITNMDRVPLTGESLDETLVPVNQARHMPPHMYTSPEIFAMEKEKIFLKDWLGVARVDEIPKSGDYMTLRIIDEPIVVVRGADGRTNAFSNVCRHRGVEVAQGQGNVTSFTCPYHSWTYDLEGKLVRAPYMDQAERFDPKTTRLNPLLCEVWAGWIFVNFDRGAGPLADFVAQYEKDFGFLRMEDCMVADKIEQEFDCNWKFVVENFLDIYHVSTTHTNSFGGKDNIGGQNHQGPFPFELHEKGGFTAFYTTPESAIPSPLGKMPWMNDKPDNVAGNGFQAPNFHLTQISDHVHLLITWPVTVERTVLKSYCLLPKEFSTRPDFKDAQTFYHDFYVGVMYEDLPVAKSQQKALNSVGYEPGRLSNEEQSIHNNTLYYLDRMFGDA